MDDDRKLLVAACYEAAAMGGWEPSSPLGMVMSRRHRDIRETAGPVALVAFGMRAVIEPLAQVARTAWSADPSAVPPAVMGLVEAFAAEIRGHADVGSVVLRNLVQSTRRFATLTGLDLTRYLEGLQADVIVGAALQLMTEAAPEDVSAATPKVGRVGVDQLTQALLADYRTAVSEGSGG